MKYFVWIIIVMVLVIVAFVFLKKQPVRMGKSSKQEQAKNEKLNIPFDYLVVSGKEALDTCLKLRKDKSKVITPVIYGGKENVEYLVEAYEENISTPASLIEIASKFDINRFINSRLEAEPEIYSDQELIGDWPASSIAPQNLTANTDILTGKLLNRVYIGLIPTDNSYEVPAYLKFGGWNECPNPEDHVGIMKYWFQKYGARIISITSDTIEFTVENPPTTKEEAMALAKEHFFYCSDIVTQGTESISRLAATLLNSKYWYFWWD